MTKRTARVPGGVVELLRFFAVVFFAGVGYEVSRTFDTSERVLGPFNGVAVGVLIGSALGYVIGGVLGRTTVTAVERTELSFADVSAEQIVAGGIGAVIGSLLGAGVAWPVFLIREPFISFPLFGFAIVSIGLVGFRVGQSKREGVLDLFGARAGLTPRTPAAVSLPRFIDTSVVIDGRVLDVVRAGFLHGTTYLLRPVLDELQSLADSGDDTKRARGRRGLEVLEALRREQGVDIEVVEDAVLAVPEVDAKLVRVCLDRGAALLTLDTNLAKAAALAGVRVLNLHALAMALRPPVLAGDDVTVLPLKPGKEPGQAVAYLDDGTMVVVEGGKSLIGKETSVHVTSVLTTANGRMVFARPAGAEPPRSTRAGSAT
ncbi:MAG: hypothetical protein QOJ92_416 [Frankiales bacterium]|nr:hypothetical protein [Frankiales bacterium]